MFTNPITSNIELTKEIILKVDKDTHTCLILLFVAAKRKRETT